MAISRLGPFLISFTLTLLFFLNFCNWIFGCGCRSLWAGADAMCNIHAAHGKHCPWCSHGYAGYAIEMALITGPQLAVSVWSRWRWTARTLVCVALFPVAGAITALGFGWLDRYWTP